MITLFSENFVFWKLSPLRQQINLLAIVLFKVKSIGVLESLELEFVSLSIKTQTKSMFFYSYK